MTTRPKSKFTSAELEVMQVLWEHKEQKPAEIQERFPRSIKNPALRSLLTILVDKGHITRRKEGKAYLYKAKTKQNKAWQQQISEVINTYFNGSAQALVMNLVKTEKLSKEDIEMLNRFAESDTTESEKEEN